MNAEIRKYVAQLLETYHKRARQIAILRYELANPTTVTEKEMIDAMQFARPEDSGHPSGHISNKTFHIAMNYREQADRLNTESLWEISRELEKLMEEQSRLEYYVSLLEPQQAKVLLGAVSDLLPENMRQIGMVDIKFPRDLIDLQIFGKMLFDILPDIADTAAGIVFQRGEILRTGPVDQNQQLFQQVFDHLPGIRCAGFPLLCQSCKDSLRLISERPQ